MDTRNQTLMAVIMALIMVAGFVGVYAVAWEYDQSNEIQELYITDSNAEFPFYTYDDGNPVNITTGTMNCDNTGFFTCTPKTPVYTGNNTWAVSQDATPVPPVGQSPGRHRVILSIPAVESWYIKNINVSIYMPAMSDPRIKVSFINIYNNRAGTSTAAHWENYTINVPDAQALAILSNIKQENFYADGDGNVIDYYMVIDYDNFVVGGTLPAWGEYFTIKIEGYTLTTWTLQDSVNWVIGGSIILNGFAIVYMSDAVDFGGYIKDLPGYKRNRKR